MAQDTDKVRLTLELNARINDELELLARKSGRSKAEIIRLGLDMLSKANTAHEAGMTVGAWKEDEQAQVRKEREFVGYF